MVWPGGSPLILVVLGSVVDHGPGGVVWPGGCPWLILVVLGSVVGGPEFCGLGSVVDHRRSWWFPLLVYLVSENGGAFYLFIANGVKN